MLTQIQLPEPQAALLAACPRPRAVAPSVSVLTAPSVVPATVIAMPVVSLSARWFEGTPGFGAVAAERVERAPRPVGYVAAGIVGKGSNGISRKQDQQDKQHLTARRGPVTWRPPH
ncbi:MAG TPA: hypothetical protein VFN97_24745 [Actinospica sp.]|nr:hypothetical protein [Actinospica sp.]